MGDRIRMNAISSPRAYMRSLATRESDKALSKYVQEAIDICKEAGYDFETMIFGTALALYSTASKSVIKEESWNTIQSEDEMRLSKLGYKQVFLLTIKSPE